MDLWRDTNWFALQAKPLAEEVARESVATLDLATFLPRASRERCVGLACRRAIGPLFPGYLFARFAPATHLHLVRYCRGVCRVIGAGSIPVPVEEDLIEDIRAREGDDGYVRLDGPCWRRGERVDIQQGPLRGWSGVFEKELDDHRRVSILLNTILGARVVVEKRSLQAI
ncbi:MAG TPA: transcription termination/antitermination NusG family protein [Verrucomicrobiota bacterium]|nr:transcription termination/antitermination NusG family protein [Verrucomicrobiota bacterium]HRZ35780.1 transcription termination/antitermination NusG family protein [Candidatus Paceibacterota bacterium]HRZ57296.1 transcription termination/antitermination NusG family protein [Candidatus Paceibacterota bacterium]